MKALKIAALFLTCRLFWIWIDQCGAELGLGEALPFCLDCSGAATTARLVILTLGGLVFVRTLRQSPEETQIRDEDMPPGRMYLIHWHRIALLIIIITYPILISWFDKNTTIPGPESLALTNFICEYTSVKGSMIWSVIVTFVVVGFRILHKK